MQRLTTVDELLKQDASPEFARGSGAAVGLACKIRARWALLGLSLAGFTATAAASQAPTFAEFVGREFGERITVHAETVAYLERLAETSPRVAVVDQGRTWEGRRLPLAIVTSEANHARLEEIQAAAQRLTDPRRLPPDEAAELIATQPAIVWLGGSIHGFELSGTEGLLKLLEHLSTRDDDETLRALENTVVLIDPTLNPDGRDAFAQTNHRLLGREPNPRRDDWSNDYNRWEGLGFRTGHYFFDHNRDWFVHTQQGIRARVSTLLQWRPQVVVDAHEMGPDTEFYFDPPTDPVGPYFPEFARRWLERFGTAYAQTFDAEGFEYTQRELFNYFYPGYTTSYGSYQGAVGMLYEQGSSRGLALERSDQTVRTLRQALTQQYSLAWTAVRVAAAERRQLLSDYYQARRDAVAEGGGGEAGRYILPGPEAGGDPNRIAELGDLLRRNGIEVDVLTEAAQLIELRDRQGREAADRAFPAGSLVVEAAQPNNRLIRALLEPHLPVPEDFLAQARARVDRGENPRFYDITAWSLPLLFDLSAYSSTDASALPLRRLEGPVRDSATFPTRDAAYAYLIDGGQTAALPFLYHLRQQGFRASMSTRPLRAAGREFASGTVIVRTGGQSEGLGSAVRELAGRFRVDVLAVDTGIAEVDVDGGKPTLPALGSVDTVSVRPVSIALLAEEPVHAYSFGWSWFVLERQYEIPVTVRRVRSLARTPLDEHDVLLIPDLFSAQELADALGEAGIERIRRWVRDGGTLIAIGSAVDFARRQLDLIALESWYPEADPTGEADEDSAKEAPRRFSVPGAVLRVVLDPESWLTAGLGGELPALVTSDRIFTAPKGPPHSGRRVAARYDTDDPLMAGHAWSESLERLPGTVFAYEERVGSGRVIAFSEDVSFRGYWRGSDRLLLNAVVVGPTAP